MKNSDTKLFILSRANLLTLAFVFFAAIQALIAQQPVTVFTAEQEGGEILVVINQTYENPATNPPQVRLYEVVKTGDKTKTVLRNPQRIDLSRNADGNLEIKIVPPPPSIGFVNYDIDVSNCLSQGDSLNFRDSVLPVVKAQILEGNGNKVRVRFDVPSTVAGGCENARSWIIAAFNQRAETTLKIKRSNNQTIDYKIIEGATDPVLQPPVGNNEFAICSITSNLTLNGSLPVGETFDPALIVFNENFINSDITTVDNRAFARLRGGIKGKITTRGGLSNEQKRDTERKVVLEVGGGLTTSKKLENAPSDSDRTTTGFLDLRIATPTRYSFDIDLDAQRLKGWWSWTPAQFDAIVSTGKLSTSNISTNTLRLFTQAQYTRQFARQGADDRLIFNFEGGVAADRDLRVIDYTGITDIRYRPGFLNRVLATDSVVGETPIVLFEIMPAGVELGGRQVRRDPLFIADNFIRRFKFGGKLEFQFPPYAQISFENRSWIRGEVSSNRFRNYFNSTLNLFPGNLNTNFSAGVFLSYERGTLPPFTTPNTSTFKVGFRVRKKQW